jgi:type IV pilus assembly protein PilV
MKHARGFTLVEVLIALVVLSIGLLGVAALQLTSLRTNSSAAMRSQATVLAYEIVDRMRANQAVAKNVTPGYQISYMAVPNGTTVADRDLIAWRQHLTNTLGPTAQSQITRNGTGDAATFVVSIQWADVNDAGTARENLVFQTETQL